MSESVLSSGFFWIHYSLLPLFATWFIPNSIRDQRTGEYLGLNNVNARLCLVLVIALECWNVLRNYEFGMEAVLRIMVCVALPFIGAYLFVKLTHKKLFGREIMFTRWW